MHASVRLLAPSTRGLRLSQLISALSFALDLTEGQPPGHSVRTCWIGMAVGRRIGLSAAELRDLYYTLLLKDLGCSSNAARICELYLTDDRSFKSDFKRVNSSLPHVLAFVMSHTGQGRSLGERGAAIVNVLKNGPQIAHELIETRCTRGAEIARKLRFSEAVAEGVHGLDEHWDGSGKPWGARGEAIPLYSRIALLAQVIDVFWTAGGPAAALMEAGARSGSWFDPALAAAFRAEAADPVFWSTLSDPDLPSRISRLEPAQDAVPLDEDYLDDIAAGFGQVVDAKSPFTSGHSMRVADYAADLAEALGLEPERRRWLHRAALLHDLGKLGVSNAVLDKPGRLEPDEWVAVKAHAAHTHAILSRIDAFDELARVAAAHHERLDGAGYPLGLKGDQIPLETRIITAADFYDALTAERPYRAAMPSAEALAIMRQEVGGALDPKVFEALANLPTKA